MKPLIIANWKCNPNSLEKAKKILKSIPFKKEVIICPPTIFFHLANKINLGSQNCFHKSGAFTGEISPEMLKKLKINYVILGHSERRNHFQEDDQLIKLKVEACLKAKLKPILCIGEAEGQEVKKTLTKQLSSYQPGVFAVAYEPVWAIGTGKACEPKKAQEVLKFIKQKVKAKILYGGSVNSSNFQDYLDVGFDGILIGGASLDIKEFKKII